jgi:uncharacterized membrane protein
MRTTASLGGHPLHVMIVHFPIGFLIGAASLDVAAAVGVPVPAIVPGYLLGAGLITGILAIGPGTVDFLTSLRPVGGHRALKTIRHAVLSIGALGVFAAAWALRGDVASTPTRYPLLLELVGVALLTGSGVLGGSLVLDDRVGVAEALETSISGERRAGQ